MNKEYKAFDISLYEGVCIVRLMNRKQCDAWMNGEGDGVFNCKTYNICNGAKVVSIFVDTDNNFSVATIED